MTVATYATLPAADAPAEVRGRTRADVALLVATRSDGAVRDGRFEELATVLRPGDLLVVNGSATLPAALAGRLDGQPVHVHLSTPVRDRRWIIELRGHDLSPLDRPCVGARVHLPGNGRLTVRAPYRTSRRLVEADLDLPLDTRSYLARHGSPIRYRPEGPRWPLAAYQTVFAREPGSAEMPSAARPFSSSLVTKLVAQGVLFAPLTLHAGVSSLERDETPYPERFRVPVHTAKLVNRVHEWGGRIIAVGTTVVRALESSARVDDGTVAPVAGWTDLVITPERGLRVVDGLLTGWHEPESSHLWMLEAAAGRDLLVRSYAAAAELGFVGHEFGDAHLILP